MPKTIYLPDGQVPGSFTNSGIDITWTKSTGKLYIGGWFDSFVGIQGSTITLSEFFDRLGITDKDILKAIKQRNGGREKWMKTLKN